MFTLGKQIKADIAKRWKNAYVLENIIVLQYYIHIVPIMIQCSKKGTGMLKESLCMYAHHRRPW